MNIFVTGAKGFIGKNLTVALRRRGDMEVLEYDVDSAPGIFEKGVSSADVIFHLAGVNRPENPQEFEAANSEFTQQLCDAIRRLDRRPLLVLSSSTQASLDNPYGISKRKAEEAVFKFGKETGAPVAVFRLPGVYGKWCRPNYNSVVASFCHNVAHDLPISISDPAREVELVYIGDVVAAFIEIMDGQRLTQKNQFHDVEPVFRITLGKLADTIRAFRESRRTLMISDFSGRFARCLYATYLSHLPIDDFAYTLNQKVDNRGTLAELLKSPPFGQIFISRIKPGVTRGDHYHDLKVEKFCVVEGKAVIRFRHILGKELIEYPVTGEDFRVVDIPPGYTHSIENVGDGILVTLFWAAEVFDSERPDTYFEKVKG